MKREGRHRSVPDVTGLDAGVLTARFAEDATDSPSPQEIRAERKRRSIMESALPLFLKNGYLGTSVDEIAAVASVSKQTVYKHFGNKEGLFTDIIFSTIDEAYTGFDTTIRALRDSDDVEQDLRVFARVLVTTLMQSRAVQVRRLVIAEANRFPELGAAYYERTYSRAVGLLAAGLEHLSDRGLLRVADPMLGAHHLTWLILGIPRNKAILCGDHIQFTTAELEGYADAAVGTFLAAYG